LTVGLVGCGGGGSSSNPSNGPTSSNITLKNVPLWLQDSKWQGIDKTGKTITLNFSKTDFSYSRQNDESFTFCDKFRGFSLEQISERFDKFSYDVDIISTSGSQALGYFFSFTTLNDGNTLDFSYTYTKATESGAKDTTISIDGMTKIN
jgi:hypothetical protein